jgi:hypothetical protein
MKGGNFLEKGYMVHYALAIVAIIVVMVLSMRREHFAAEFVDHSKERKNDLTRISSYAQETNHFKPVSSLQEPVSGLETPFRVNLYNSFME